MVDPTAITELLRELADYCENLPLERALLLSARARQAAEEIEAAADRAAILSCRLKQLSIAVTEDRMGEFTMRIPAEPDRDADLVLNEASRLLARFGGGEAGSG